MKFSIKKTIFSIFLLLICNTVSFGQNKLIKKFLKYDPIIRIPYYSGFNISINESKNIESLKEEIIKYKSKNGEDISTVFVEFFIKVQNIEKWKDDNPFPIPSSTSLEYSNLLYHEFNKLSNSYEKYSFSELDDIGIFDVSGSSSQLTTEFDTRYLNYLDSQNFRYYTDKREWGDQIWVQRIFYLNHIKSNRNNVVYSEIFSKLRDLFIEELEFYRVSNVEFSVNSDWRIRTEPSVSDLEKINEKLKKFPNWNENENNFKWGEQYSFIDDELKQTISEFLFLKNLWVNFFKDYKNDELNNIESFEIPDCYIVTDYIIEKINSEKFDSFTLQQLYQIKEFYNDNNINCNIHEPGFNTRKRIPSIKRFMVQTVDNLISNKKNKNTGYCVSEKHKERLLEEFYPKNGLKITKGILKIELKSDMGCSFTWEVFDTTLLGKTRISYFTTSVNNPDDKEIVVKLDGTDTF